MGSTGPSVGLNDQHAIQYNTTNNTMQYETHTQYDATRNVDEPQYNGGGFASPPATAAPAFWTFCSMLNAKY